MADNEIILTPEGRQKLVEELAWREGGARRRDHRAHQGRPRLRRPVRELRVRRRQGGAQSKNASRVAEIRKILSTAKVSAGAGHVMAVSIGCTVEIQEQGKDKTCAFTIVGTTETNSLEHKISNESPVGSALMGHAKGDVIEVTSPSGVTRHYTIVKISR